MRIGFETTVNACDAAAVRSSGVAAAGRRHGAAGQPLPGFRGQDETAGRVPDMC